MDINFFDNPEEAPRMREDVCFNNLGIFVYPDGRRVAVGFDLTPFVEKPSIEVIVTNADGVEVATLNVIEAISPNFSLTLHLRETKVNNPYQATATIYYLPSDPDPDKRNRQVVDEKTADFSLPDPIDDS